MDRHTLNLFGDNGTRPGAMGCRAEVVQAMAAALRRAAERGITREEVASRMATFLGEKFGVGTLNGLVAQSHTTQAEERGNAVRDISLLKAMAFDAAVEEDVLLGLFAHKRGDRQVVSSDDAALLEWAHLHRQEKELAERKKAIEAALRLKGGK
jgi:hypothetical protein